MAYACKTSSARNIVGVIPYMPYCKQSKMRKRGCIVSKLLAKMMCERPVDVVYGVHYGGGYKFFGHVKGYIGTFTFTVQCVYKYIIYIFMAFRTEITVERTDRFVHGVGADGTHG